MNVDSPPLMVPNIKANKLVGIAVVSPKRIPLLPDVPTMAESGYPGVTMGQWFGIVGPANMPKRSEEHTSELQSLMRISYAVFCLKKKNTDIYKLCNVKYNRN